MALCEYMVQLSILSLATPIFPTKFATVALRSSMRQCGNYNGHTYLQLLNRVIHSNTEVECLARVWLCLENFEPAPIWFSLESLQKSGGLWLDLHLWARISKTKKWKFSKKIVTNTLRFAKFANIFFRKLFLLYGNICSKILPGTWSYSFSVLWKASKQLSWLITNMNFWWNYRRSNCLGCNLL